MTIDLAFSIITCKPIPSPKAPGGQRLLTTLYAFCNLSHLSSLPKGTTLCPYTPAYLPSTSNCGRTDNCGRTEGIDRWGLPMIPSPRPDQRRQFGDT